MKRAHLLLLLVFILTCSLLMAGEQITTMGKKIQPMNKVVEKPAPMTREAPDYVFYGTTHSLITSYYDYMIGGYTNLPMRVQPADHGNGIYLTYHGKPTPTGQRRAYYAYLDENGDMVINGELTLIQNWEGYPSVDVDPLSGKPIFAWHVDLPPVDQVYDVQLTWDAFLDGQPGIINDPFDVVHAPTTITVDDITTTDNEFLWPKVLIGPSPTEGMSRAYVLSTNSVSHSVSGNATENPYLIYADFNESMLSNGEALTWFTNTIPTLDRWNVDTEAWRRPYDSFVVGNDGRIYYIGYHLAQTAAGADIVEPTMDVFINDNFGEGDWTQTSVDPTFGAWLPYNLDGSAVFTVDPGVKTEWTFTDSGHFNATIDSLNVIHFPAIFGLSTNDAHYFPGVQSVRNMSYDADANEFESEMLWPKSAAPLDSIYVPYDLNNDQQVDSYSDDGIVEMSTIWPFPYWDETAHANAMLFNYNNHKFTEANSEGMMAAVWQDSWRARMANLGDTTYTAYSDVPEIFVSVSGDLGQTWSEPLVMNSLENSQLAGQHPMWVYPADKVQFLGYDSNNNKLGRLYLLYYDDNTWGSAQMESPILPNDGGTVSYMAIDITYPTAAGDNPLPPVTNMLKQNYPNPFNPETTISFNIPKVMNVNLSIFNTKGQLVKTITNGTLASGEHKMTWNGTDNNGKSVSSGLYFYKLKTDGKSESRKMMLVK